LPGVRRRRGKTAPASRQRDSPLSGRPDPSPRRRNQLGTLLRLRFAMGVGGMTLALRLQPYSESDGPAGGSDEFLRGNSRSRRKTQSAPHLTFLAGHDTSVSAHTFRWCDPIAACVLLAHREHRIARLQFFISCLVPTIQQPSRSHLFSAPAVQKTRARRLPSGADRSESAYYRVSKSALGIG